MAIILSLETSTNVCSVAVHDKGKLIALEEVHREHSHASKLAIMIEEVGRLAGIKMSDLAAVAVSAGPGSYTGLRIGASTAKGLCYALSIPLLAIGTLELLTLQARKWNGMRAWLCPMIDARRMEVYCTLSDAENNLIQGVEASVIDERSFRDHLEQNPILFFGDGAGKCRSVITHPNAVFVEGIHPSAASMGEVGWKKYQVHAEEDVVGFEPFYLKEFRVKKPSLKEGMPNKIGS